MTMPSFSKSPPELVERFTSLTAGLPDVERRQMFGYPCLFVGGNLVSGLYQDRWHVRLAEPDRAELLALPGARPFEPMPGRQMGGYVVLPPSIVADDATLRQWVERAIEFGRNLPAKSPRSSKGGSGSHG
jgi:TfoX/Sxy family transcriptional regulator of competence genes